MNVFMEEFALKELELCGITSLSEANVKHDLGTSSAASAMSDLQASFLEAEMRTTRLDERVCLIG